MGRAPTSPKTTPQAALHHAILEPHKPQFGKHPPFDKYPKFHKGQTIILHIDGQEIPITFRQSLQFVGRHYPDKGHWYAIKPRDPKKPKQSGSEGVTKLAHLIEDPTTFLLDTDPQSLTYGKRQKTFTAPNGEVFQIQFANLTNELQGCKLFFGMDSDVSVTEKEGDKSKGKGIRDDLPGDNFLDYTNDRDLTLPQYITLFFSITLLVKNVHAAKMLHNDIKPENILIDNKKEVISVYLIDWSTWKPIDYQGNFLGGTMAYMAPEVWRTRKVSAASDIFSLGATLLVVLGITSPFGERHDLLNEINEQQSKISSGKLSASEISAINSQLSGLKQEFRKKLAQPLTLDHAIKQFSDKFPKLTVTGEIKALLNLLCSMVDFNPVNRPSLDKVLMQLNQLQPPVSTSSSISPVPSVPSNLCIFFDNTKFVAENKQPAQDCKL